MDKNIKFGVVGVGHLGKFHVQQIKKVSQTSLCGVYDLDYKKALSVANQHQTKAYKNLEDLLCVCSAVSVVVSTPFHCKVATQALMNNCHVFIEKPITNNISDAKRLIALAKEKHKKIQVGHIERFNPAYKAYCVGEHKPLFIECNRLAPYNVRGSDVPVVLDLMIHDIDLILHLVQKPLISIHASGASVISDYVDLANARLLFKGGVTANLTASRISTKQLRQMRVFEKNCYTALDFQEHTLKKLNLNVNKKFVTQKVEVESGNALFWELESFIKCIITDSETLIDGEQGLHALEIAMEIQGLIEKQQNT